MKMRRLAPSLLLLFLSAVAGATPEQVRINRSMIGVYESSSSVRDRGGDNQLPRSIRNGISEISSAGIPVFYSVNDLALHPDLREVILQEYLRQADWGMPWLPLSWTTGVRDTEDAYRAIVNNMNGTVARLARPLGDDNLLLTYLYFGSIYHTNNAGDVINEMRGLADRLGQEDSRFWDIRVEIHQEPSLRTLRRVEAYLAGLRASESHRRDRAERIVAYLKSLFGEGALDAYLQSIALPGPAISAFGAYRAALASVTSVSDATGARRALDAALPALGSLAAEALRTALWVRDGIGQTDANVDLLRQLHRAVFSLGGALQERLSSTSAVVSLDETLRLVEAYAQAAVATGMLEAPALAPLERFRAEATGPVELERARILVRELEGTVPAAARRLRGLFGAYFARYGAFVPQVDRFVDETLRSSTLLPMANALASLASSLQARAGTSTRVGGQPYSEPARVLNVGIARGELVILGSADAANEEYSWNPGKIYLLTKTPAWIQKVSGILTCDSGSMISHVQLLASNHGLPNVNVPCSITERLRPLEGKEILLVSLPNGEVTIKAWADATADERAALQEYTQAKQRLKVRLPRPSRLDINYPLKLEQLRMSDSGKVAGGKACGQGELAAVFPDHVPRGIVLPFGVYYENIKAAGLDREIQAIFSDPRLRGSDAETVRRRAEALGYVRGRIQSMELLPHVESFLVKALLSHPFRGRGVFVRSDTNAEDLPEFVGAGLNETKPNVVGVKNILQAVREVWSSPFKEKAFTWRDDLIENPWDIFPSVIIQIGINSDKAGVMVVGSHETDDLEDAVLLAGNEGLGITTVNGEYVPEELIFSRKTRTVTRLRRAYAQTRKSMLPQGGFAEHPARGLDPLITDAEAAALADAGDAIQKHAARTYGELGKWDLEWGIVDGRVILFQVRPFIGNKVARNVSTLLRLQTTPGTEAPRVDPAERAFLLLQGGPR
jgi:hypothetical protein